MSTEVLGAEIQFKIDKALAALKEIGDAGSAAGKDVARELSKNLKEATKEAKKLAAETKKTQQETADFGKVAGDTGGKLGKMAGAASLADGRLGELARTGNDLFDVGEVLLGSFGALGPAIGAAAAAAAAAAGVWYVLNAAEAENARINAEVMEAQQKLAPITDALRMATIDLDEATGKLTETQAKNARDSVAALQQLQAATEDTRKKIGELGVQQGSVWTQMVDGVESVIPEWTPFGYAIRAVTTDSADLGKEIDALNGVITEGQRKTKALVETEQAAGDAKRNHAAATEALKVSLAELNAVMAQENALAATNEQAFNSALGSLQAQENAATKAGLSKEQLIERTHAEAVATAAAERDKALAVSSGVAAREAIDAQYRATTRALDVQRVADQQALEEDLTRKVAEESRKRLEDAQREAEARVRYEEQALSAQASLIGSLTDVMASAASTMADDQKDALMALWVAQQIGAAAQAAINMELGVSQAAASAPPPYNAIPIAAAYAQGIAAEVAIATSPPPSFSDTPGVQQMGMGGQVGLGAGDYFAAARSPEDLRRQVERAAPAADRGPSVSLIGRRIYGEQLRDATQWSSPMIQEIAGSRPRRNTR